MSTQPSYTEKEHDYAVAKGIPVIALLHANPESIEFGKTEQTEEGRGKLAKFREKAQGGRLSKEWKTPDDLAGLVSRALHISFKRFPATGWIRADKAASEDLLSEINVLRKENDNLKQQLAAIDRNHLFRKTWRLLMSSLPFTGQLSRIAVFTEPDRRGTGHAKSRGASCLRKFPHIC